MAYVPAHHIWSVTPLYTLLALAWVPSQYIVLSILVLQTFVHIVFGSLLLQMCTVRTFENSEVGM